PRTSLLRWLHSSLIASAYGTHERACSARFIFIRPLRTWRSSRPLTEWSPVTKYCLAQSRGRQMILLIERLSTTNLVAKTARPTTHSKQKAFLRRNSAAAVQSRRMWMEQTRSLLNSGCRSIGESGAASTAPLSQGQFRLSLAHDQHRQVGMRDDFSCLAAEEQASKPATTMRRHDDQVAVIVLGHLQNALGGMAVSDVDSGELDAFAFHQLDRSIEDTVCARCRRLFEFLDEVLISALCERRHFHSRPWLCHRHNGDQCAGGLGEATAVDKTLGCKLRSIGGNKDMLVHGNAVLSISKRIYNPNDN